jgi:hypothetical protein
VLATLQEIVNLLENDGDLAVWLKSKVNAALLSKTPFLYLDAG